MATRHSGIITPRQVQGLFRLTVTQDPCPVKIIDSPDGRVLCDATWRKDALDTTIQQACQEYLTVLEEARRVDDDHQAT